jgi:hypothetical protein
MSDSANAGIKAMQTPTRTEAEAMAERCPWKVGKTYWTYSRVSKVRILSTTLRAKQSIAGVMYEADEPEEGEVRRDEEVWQFFANGAFHGSGELGRAANDLTLEEATP